MTANGCYTRTALCAAAMWAAGWAAAADFEVRVCRLQVRLVNNLPYEIRSLVPEFAIFRASGVVYDSVFAGFGFVKPGDSQRREVRFNGIDCADIARVRVGGDRCEMGDLDKFSNAKGACLSHVRVEASAVMKFDK